MRYQLSRARGHYYYFYLAEDIYGREIHDSKCGEKAAALMQRTVIAEQCLFEPIVLHSDNGNPMKSQTLLAKLNKLGISPSRSWLRVSNDNPYSESLFRTFKYRPPWPSI